MVAETYNFRHDGPDNMWKRTGRIANSSLLSSSITTRRYEKPGAFRPASPLGRRSFRRVRLSPVPFFREPFRRAFSTRGALLFVIRPAGFAFSYGFFGHGVPAPPRNTDVDGRTAANNTRLNNYVRLERVRGGVFITIYVREKSVIHGYAARGVRP